jgi:ceramide synthetase
MKKFQDQAWQLAIHVTMTMWEIRLLIFRPEWWQRPQSIFEGVSVRECNAGVRANAATLSLELECFIVFQLALWIVTGISCKWLEERRKDYLEMMFHHIITITAVILCYNHNEWAIGMVVLVVHDASDIILDLMKMTNYLKLEESHGAFTTEILFVLNTYVSWPYLRLYVFPIWIIRSIIVGYQTACLGSFVTWNPLEWPTFITVRVGLLASLMCLHIFWFYLLNRIAYKLIFTDKAANEIGEEEYEVNRRTSRTSSASSYEARRITRSMSNSNAVEKDD